MTLFQVAILAVQLAATDPRSLAAVEAGPPDPLDAASQVQIQTQAEIDTQEAALAAAEFMAELYGGNVETYLITEATPAEPENCIPAQNAKAHLSRVTRQMRQVLDLMDAEIQSGQASPRLQTAYRTLLNDDEMKMGRYMVQVLIDNNCND